jgi:hypothetical protein
VGDRVAAGAMTAMEQLRILQEQFPRSRQLAVSRELLEQFLTEMVATQRFVTTREPIPAFPPEEVLAMRGGGSLVVQPLNLVFRSSHLALTERRA